MTTYTVMGRCAATGHLGIGLTTASLAVGGFVPFLTAGGDIVASQAYAQPGLGLEAVRLLNAGLCCADLLARLNAFDSFFAYRQLGVLTRSGESFVHTGAQTRPWAGHRIGPDYLVMGNVLAGERVLAAMATAFEGRAGDLADRLLAALEAGRDAGGQVGPGGRRYAERSAALRIVGEGGYPELDLRVDMHAAAVGELRRMYDIYKAYNLYNRLRAEDPPHTPALAEWEDTHLRENPPPPVFA